MVDGLGSPARVGLLLPLHWQTVALLLAGVATGATVVVAREADALAGCDAAFVRADAAEQALDAGVDEVLALSGHPLGAPAGALPPAALDYAREVPSYGDHWSGRPGAPVSIEVAGQPLGPLPEWGLGPADRVLVAVEPSDPVGLAALLGVLRSGASAVLLPVLDVGLDLAATAGAERATASLGTVVPDLRTLEAAG